MKKYLWIVVIFRWPLLLFSGCTTAGNDPNRGVNRERLPNFIVIFTDDQGYEDLSCFEDRHVSTPHIDRLAKEGAKLTGFYGKYHQILPDNPTERSRSEVQGTALYNLENDIGVTWDLSAQFPEIVAQFQDYIKAFEIELGKSDSLSPQCRPAGRIDNPKPLSKENR